MLFGGALVEGIIFSVLFGVMITIIEIINPRFELHNYPLAIRNTVAQKTNEERKKFKMLDVPILAILIIYFIGTIVQAYTKHETSYFIYTQLYYNYDMEYI